jgi:ABC-2 type transport system permease protein
LLQQRLMVILFVVALFFPVGCIAFVYLANHLELLAGVGAVPSFLKIDAEFFLVFMNAQSAFAVILSAFAGPNLIAADLANGALPLYFSRPLSRAEYVIARMLVLVGVLSPVTWIPGMLLFLMQSGMAGWTWFRENWYMGLAILAGFFFWIAFVSLVAMASSAYVKWRVIAGVVVLGFFFWLSGAAEFVNQVMRVEWAAVMSPARAMNQIWRAMLGAEANSGPSAVPCAIVMSSMVAVVLWVLARKLRPVEIVS